MDDVSSLQHSRQSQLNRAQRQTRGILGDVHQTQSLRRISYLASRQRTIRDRKLDNRENERNNSDTWVRWRRNEEESAWNGRGDLEAA